MGLVGQVMLNAGEAKLPCPTFTPPVALPLAASHTTMLRSLRGMTTVMGVVSARLPTAEGCEREEEAEEEEEDVAVVWRG